MEYVGFYSRNRNCDFGYIPSVWALGSLGLVGSQGAQYPLIKEHTSTHVRILDVILVRSLTMPYWAL